MPPLSQLAQALHYTLPAGPDPEIQDVTEDSREVAPGWLFVAIKGGTRDGHDYVQDAISRGAAAIVSEETMCAPTPVIRVPNSRQALADIAARIHNFPSKVLEVYGITGTDGKTTTSYLLSSILDAAGRRAGMITTVETRIGGMTQPSTNRMTTPSAPFIQRTLAAMARAGDAACVLETSSHALAQGRVRNVTLHAAGITNIGSDHIEFHGSRENYARAKASIFDLVVEATEPRIVLNAHDEWSLRLRPNLHRPVLTFGTADNSDVRADVVSSTLDATSLVLCHGNESVEVRLPLAGSFNVSNALAASAVAITGRIPLSAIKRGLESARKPPGRLQQIDVGQPFSVVVDYAHTVQAFSSLIEFLRRCAYARGGAVIVVFGAAGDRDREKRPEMARIAARACDFFVITNEDPFSEEAASIIAEITAGAPAETRGSQWISEADRRAAIAVALDRAGPNDIVAITGKGHERSIAVGDHLVPWSDAEIARDLLQERIDLYHSSGSR